MLADAWAFLLTTRPVKLPIEAVPTAFAKDGIHLSHEGSWQLACAAFVELLRICGGEGEVEGSGAGGCTTSWRGGAWRGAWRSGLAACENREARTRASLLVHSPNRVIMCTAAQP